MAGAYYRDLFIDDTIDNPDQRIQQDVDIFTAGVGGTPNIPSNETANTLLFGAVRAVVSVVSFAAILWDLSGPLDIFGFHSPRAMFWVVWSLLAIATGVAFRLGRPLIWLSFNNEKLNAAFRYALVRLRDAAEAVGFYRGEQVRTQLWRSFHAGHRQLPQLRPPDDRVQRLELVDVPGDRAAAVDRSGATAFCRSDRLRRRHADGDRVRRDQRFIVVLPQQLRRLRRLPRGHHPFARAGRCERQRPRPARGADPATDDGSVEFDGVEVRTPDGDPLVDSLDVRLEPGQSLVITGQSGAGKTTLLRSLAELWPYASGTLRCPDGDNDDVLSQLPYVPLGSLRTVVCYPARRPRFGRAAAPHLIRVALPTLINRLDEEP